MASNRYAYSANGRMIGRNGHSIEVQKFWKYLTKSSSRQINNEKYSIRMKRERKIIWNTKRWVWNWNLLRSVWPLEFVELNREFWRKHLPDGGFEWRKAHEICKNIHFFKYHSFFPRSLTMSFGLPWHSYNFQSKQSIPSIVSERLLCFQHNVFDR